MPTRRDAGADGPARRRPTFRFALKSPRRITHEKRLRRRRGEVERLAVRGRRASLGDKLGPVLFQLPPNVKKDLARLDAFLGALPAGLRGRRSSSATSPGSRRRRLRAACASAAPRCASPRPRTWRRRSRRRPTGGTCGCGGRTTTTPRWPRWGADAFARRRWDRGLRLLQARGRRARGPSWPPQLAARSSMAQALSRCRKSGTVDPTSATTLAGTITYMARRNRRRERSPSGWSRSR